MFICVGFLSHGGTPSYPALWDPLGPQIALFVPSAAPVPRLGPRSLQCPKTHKDDRKTRRKTTGKATKHMGKPTKNMGKPTKNMGKPTKHMGKPRKNQGSLRLNHAFPGLELSFKQCWVLRLRDQLPSIRSEMTFLCDTQSKTFLVDTDIDMFRFIISRFVWASPTPSTMAWHPLSSISMGAPVRMQPAAMHQWHGSAWRSWLVWLLYLWNWVKTHPNGTPKKTGIHGYLFPIPQSPCSIATNYKLLNYLILGQSQRFGDPIVTSPQSNTTLVVPDSRPSRIKSILGFVIFKVFRSWSQALAASSDRKSWCLGDVWVLSSGKAQNILILVNGSLVGLPQYPRLLWDPPINQQEKCGKPSIMGTIWLSKLD